MQSDTVADDSAPAAFKDDGTTAKPGNDGNSEDDPMKLPPHGTEVQFCSNTRRPAGACQLLIKLMSADFSWKYPPCCEQRGD